MKPVNFELLNHSISKCFERFDYIKHRDEYEKNLEEQVKRQTESIYSLFNESIKSLSKITALRDPYTAGHQKRVTDLALAISQEMNLSEDICQSIKIAGLLHDVGKICVPTEILVKPARLTKKEIGLMQEHVTASYNIVKNIPFQDVLNHDVAEIILQHHERLDGSGYPRNLKENEIYLETKILSVCDVIESMSLHRPYRPALGLKKTLDEIRRGCGTVYDNDVCQTAIAILEPYGDSLMNYFKGES
jgi:HD-GYP domain-containing protein (c-di-GMP phosphodiesterase class II)